MNNIAQNKEEVDEIQKYRLIKKWAARFQRVFAKEELLELLELGEDEFNAWFGGALGGQGTEVVPRLTQKKKKSP